MKGVSTADYQMRSVGFTLQVEKFKNFPVFCALIRDEFCWEFLEDFPIFEISWDLFVFFIRTECSMNKLIP